MVKIIDSNPAAYPASNTSELKAIATFNSLIDLTRVKPFINSHDNVPNTDGHIEIVTEAQVSLGKLEVQIKSLDKKNVLNPKYQCSKEFLAYCQESISPVLLIVVNSDDKIAYWQYIDIPVIVALSKKLKKESVNLDFEITNCVSSKNTDYLEKWISILNDRREKIFNYDAINERKKQVERELKEFKEYADYSVGKKDPVYAEIHTFLDYYNGLLEDDFISIKNILYPDYWKIGLGYGEYDETSVNFMLFPILYDVNDIQIKKFDPKHVFKMKGALKIMGQYGDNPIKTKPEKYAYKLIEDDIKDALKDQPLVVKDTFLAKEYVFAFIDRFHSILGLKANEHEYEVSDIEHALYRFLPFFIGEIVHRPEKLKHKMFSFDIDRLYYQPPEALVKSVAEAKKKLRKNPLIEIARVYLISEDFNVDILLRLLGYLNQEKLEVIRREYDPKNITIKDRSYYKWEAWSNASILKNLKLFYSNFSRIYDSIVSTYFPNLFEDLKYYDDFNLLIVVVDFRDKGQGITMESFYLESTTPATNRTLVYNAKDPDVPIRKETAREIFKTGLTFDNNKYQLKNQWGTYLRFLFDKTPLLAEATKLLNERLKEYFEKKQGN